MLFKPGHNTPPHLFMPDALYMLTGAIYQGDLLMCSDERKEQWIRAFFTAIDIYHWQTVAWVVLDNYYHAVLKSPEDSAASMPKLVASYHKYTARLWNEEEHLSGRKVWRNYWDTCVRSEDDYLNRLRYIFWNPVRHGLVNEPAEYKYSNYKDFLQEEWFGIGHPLVEAIDVPEF